MILLSLSLMLNVVVLSLQLKTISHITGKYDISREVKRFLKPYFFTFTCI